jgi:hypothetical protein
MFLYSMKNGMWAVFNEVPFVYRVYVELNVVNNLHAKADPTEGARR